jgi:hypothetical protein
MNEEVVVEDNTSLLLLPRPWLEPAVEEVRERGPLTLWTRAGRTYVRGVVGTKRLAYWHRIVPLKSVITPM